MHIETGVVQGAKILLGYATASVVVGVGLRLSYENIKQNGLLSFVLKTIISTIIIFGCFEILPHYPIGVSEVHLILGTTIFLIFGIAPAMVGLAFGLLIQGVFFAPFDLPQYGINITTLLASMILLNIAVKKIIPNKTAYKDISYSQMLKISIIWEGAIVSWVAFWALYGQGFGSENLSQIFSFGGAYMSVIIIEPLIDLTILSLIKTINFQKCNIFFDKKLNNCETI